MISISMIYTDQFFGIKPTWKEAGKHAPRHSKVQRILAVDGFPGGQLDIRRGGLGGVHQPHYAHRPG